MDEGTLNDLLECSVCLDRLDTSSKVLPCQHTFCRKCLEEIIHKHRELRCPECRVLVSVKVDDLPPNVLLMRILEGMRSNVAPKKPPRTMRFLQPQQVHNVAVQPQVDHKQSTPHLVTHQPYAKALYDYGSKEAGDLSFKRGDVIILRKRIDNHWYQGECGGKQGVFPLSYVQIITPLPSHVPQCKALYDFRMTNDDDEGCLVFGKGDIINVIRRVDENWAEGKLDGRIGIFPLAFVELNNLARSLMKLSTNAQPGPSKVAPPTPTTEDSSTPLIPTDHSRNVQQIQQNSLISDSHSTNSSSSSTTTPNVSSSNTSSTSSTAPSSPASPPPRTQVLPPSRNIHKSDVANSSTPQRSPNNPQENKEKRHSFTSLTPPQHCKTNHRHSAEILPDQAQHSERNRKTNETLPTAYTALYPYKPQKPDELELRKGGIYMVTERCQDGWFKGTSNRTQKCGVFPGNYVVLVNNRNIGNSSTTIVTSTTDKNCPVSFTRNGKNSTITKMCLAPPELPPRSVSPNNATSTISSSWHGQQDNASVPLGRSSSSAVMPNLHAKNAEKSKERKEKGTVSLMRRLTSMKRSKSPPVANPFSMDNPVFEDSNVASTAAHPVHVRSGSCPSQLLQIQPSIEHHRILFGSTSQRHKHNKERPSVLTHNNSRSNETPSRSSGSSPDVHRHRKSNSLDAGNHHRSSNNASNNNNNSKTVVQTVVRERFRCIAPYPPNSEYELELQVNDIIYVHKKREDGWYKGTQQRTGRTGLFPASFVENF